MKLNLLALLAAVACLGLGTLAHAQSTTVSNLPLGSAVSATDNLYAEQGTCPNSPPTCNGVHVTGAQIKIWAQNGLAAVATSGSASDLTTGTLGAGRIPAPTTSAFGGVEAVTCPSHQWLNIVPTSAVQPTCAQPSAADLSDGNTGTGAVAHAASPSFTTPSLGAATATTLAVGGPLFSGSQFSGYSSAAAFIGTFVGDGQGLAWNFNTYGSAKSSFLDFQEANGTMASPTAVASGALAGTIAFDPYDGGAYRTIGNISCSVDTFTAANNISGYCDFATRTDGSAAAPVHHWRVDKNGLWIDLTPATNSTIPACSSGLKYATSAVSDASASPTYLGTYSGGGSAAGLVQCNGTAWVYH